MHPLVRILCGQGGAFLHRKLPIFYSAILLTGVNLLLRLVSTGFQVYLSGCIGAAGIGLMQLVLSVGALSVTAGMAGIRTGTMYLTAAELGTNKVQNVRWVLSGCVLYSIICSGTVSLVLNRCAPLLAQHWIGDTMTVAPIRLYAAFVPVICLCGVMTGYFTAANRIGTLAAVEVAEQFLCIAVTVILLNLGGRKSPVAACQCVILGNGIGAIFTLLCLMVLRIREHSPKGSRIPLRSRLLQTALPLAIADDIKAGLSTAENLMVPKRLSLYPGTSAPLAAFGTVCGMVFPVLMFPAAILFGLSELLIPELARCNAAGSHRRTTYLVKRGLKVALLYGLIFAGAEYLLAGPLCIKLYKSLDAAKVLRMYALLIPMLYCDALTDAMTKGMGQQRICVYFNILTSALDILFLFLLLPKWGMQGYFISFTVTHLLNFILSLRRLLRITGLRLPVYLPICALLATGAAIWTAEKLQVWYLQLPAFILIQFSLLFLFQVLQKEDLHWIKGLIRPKGSS